MKLSTLPRRSVCRQISNSVPYLAGLCVVRYQIEYLTAQVCVSSGILTLSLCDAKCRSWETIQTVMCKGAQRVQISITVALRTYCGPGWRSRCSDSLRAGRFGDRTPVGARLSSSVQTGPLAHPASCTMVTGSLSRW